MEGRSGQNGPVAPPEILIVSVELDFDLDMFSVQTGDLRVVFPTFRLSINSCVFGRAKLIETD